MFCHSNHYVFPKRDNQKWLWESDNQEKLSLKLPNNLIIKTPIHRLVCRCLSVFRFKFWNETEKLFSGFAISHALWTIFCFLSHVHLRPFSFILNPKAELMDEAAVDDYSSVRICRACEIAKPLNNFFRFILQRKLPPSIIFSRATVKQQGNFKKLLNSLWGPA
jgi:hypothetical protein